MISAAPGARSAFLSPNARCLRRRHLLAAVVAAAGAMVTSGCASTKSTASEIGAGETRTSAVIGGGAAPMGINLTTRTDANTSVIAAPIDRVWAAVQAAYARLEIPLSQLDERKHILGNEAFRTRRKVGDVPMMRALDCGGDSGMPNAETYQIVLTVRSQLSAAEGGGTQLQTVVTGIGRNPSSGGRSDVQCSSAGALEKRIAELAREGAAK